MFSDLDLVCDHFYTLECSWNTILPQGHEIIRIDFSVDSDGNWGGETTRFATDLGTPLPLRFHPNGDLYYATFGNDGSLYRITGV